MNATVSKPSVEQVGKRLYFRNLPFDAKAKVKAFGAKPDYDAGTFGGWWVGTAKRAAAEALVAELNAVPTDRPAVAADDARIYAKVKYKGRTYFVVGEFKNPLGEVVRVRLTTLDPDFPMFWASAPECELIRTYEGREAWDGRRYSGETRTVYTTVGGLRDFIAKQERAKAAGQEVCGCGCGVRGVLVSDLEDGIAKLVKCCDIPPEGY